MKDLILETISSFNFNPFGEVDEAEVEQAIIPVDGFSEIDTAIKSKTYGIIELVGQMGRGKTSQLRLLHQSYPESPMFWVRQKTKNFQALLDLPDELVFIDGIYHLSLLQRIKLFQSQKRIVCTTHTSRFLEYKLTNRSHRSFRIKGITVPRLAQLLAERIRIASGSPETKIELNPKALEHLIKRYGDNYRSILNHLYNSFQQ